MRIHRVLSRNGRIYLQEQNNSVYINSDPPAVGPYASGYYCIGSPTDVESFCHEPSCIYHSGGTIYTWCNTINGPYDTLEECETSCSTIVDQLAPISGFNFSIDNYNSSSRCESLPGGPIELCCDNPEDGGVNFSWTLPENEDQVDFYVIRRVITTPTKNISGVYEEGYLPGYNGPFCIADSGCLDDNTTVVTNFEPFIVTSISGTGDTFLATTTYGPNSSFYKDSNLSEPYSNTLGISKIEFSKNFAPKITFRSQAAKNSFVNINHDMYLYVNESGATSRDYYGSHRLLTSRIANETSTTIAYSGTLSDLTVAMSGIDHLLEDLENKGTNSDYLYIQLDYDTAELFIDNCDSSQATIKSPFVIPKWFAVENSSNWLNGSEYTVPIAFNPSCGYHSYQMIAVNESGQSVQKPNDIATMSTYESGWAFKGTQEWTVSDDGGSNLIFTWGVAEGSGFAELCPAEIGYFFNGGSNPNCPGVNGPFATAAECSAAQTECGITIPVPCYNQQLSVTLEYVSGILYSRDQEGVTYEASSVTPGYISMSAPPNGWYEFKGIEGRYVEDASGNLTLCEQDTKKCSGGGLSLFPYNGHFYVYNGQLVGPDPPYPIIN
jgi:hypothetical protein